MNVSSIFQIATLGLQVAPSIVQAVESLFKKKPATATPEQAKANSGAKAEAALQLAQQGLVLALGIDPAAFGDAEKALITGVNNALVAYYNAKGWPTP